MKSVRLTAILSLMTPLTLSAAVTDMRVENLVSPLGVGTSEPRFSWRVDAPAASQDSYRILVASSPELLAAGTPDLWDSGTVTSTAQQGIRYAGKPLRPATRAWWTVCATTGKEEHRPEHAAEFGVGLLAESQWGGRWMGLETPREGDARGTVHTVLPARYMRKEFSIGTTPVRRATAYISGLGNYRLYVNGAEIGSGDVLKPVPSDYRKTVYYNTYDIPASMLGDSTLTVGIVLGPGRYFPMRQHKAAKIPVFGNPTCRLNLIVEYADGSRRKLVTDDSWRVTDLGPIRLANEYDGEVYDARMEMPGWAASGFDDSAWLPAQRSAVPYGTLRAQTTPNMTCGESVSPLSVTPHGDRHIVDFGVNMAGWIALRPRGAEGDTIRIRFAERLNPDGTLYTANLRDARSEDIYICSGRELGEVTWTPSFTYHGFRYAEVSGLPGMGPDDIRAIHVGDPMEMSMDFECSDTILNRVVRNALRGIRANYKGMPVDCPQRNERQPWLGDRTSGALGESMFFDNHTLYAKWVRDICEAQREDGCIPDVAPAFWNYYTDNVTWPAALPMVCDMLIEQYADTVPARMAYPHIARWMEHIIAEYSRDGIVTRDRYGDWCVPPESPELIHSKDPARKTDGALISTAYTARCLALLEKFATMQGLGDDADRWRTLREKTSEAFNRRFLTNRPGTSPKPGHPLYPDSIFYGTNTPTANVLALAFGLVPDSLRHAVADNLAARIITEGNTHITTGVIGTSWLLRTLTANGRGDLAWTLATNRSYPSWGYMAEKGATTTWELWNGDTANPAMNSGNHVMLLGDLLSWVQQDLCGIRNGSQPGRYVFEADWSIPDCEYASTSRPTPWGKIQSRWERDGRRLTWRITLPSGTSGEVRLPDGSVSDIGSGTHTVGCEFPLPHPLVTDAAHLYTRTSFPQCHAATIVETREGDLVAAYFGGTHERHPDVCIWVSRKPKGSDRWSDPILAGDGVFFPGTPDALLAGVNDSTTLASVGPVAQFADADPRLRRKACWNPVLTEMPSGELWLFYKVGLRVADWTGWVVKSKDGGKTWSKREPLPQGFIGPVKNKPEIVDGRLICASSTESGGWKLHFEILDLAIGQWDYIGPIPADSAYLTEDLLPDGITPREGARLRPINCIQPSILRHGDGRLQVLMRTRNGRLATSWSDDRGRTWSRVTLTDIPNNQSGTDAVTLADGTHLLIYNPFSTLPATKKGPRTPLAVARSTDGLHWTPIVTLEDSPISQYSYPAIIQGRDGDIHCIYTWRRQRIAYRRLTLPDTTF